MFYRGFRCCSSIKSKQDEQKALDVQRNILTVAGLMKEDNASVIKDTYSKFIEPRLVDLQSGDYVQASAEEINKFEPKDAVKDPAKSQAIPAEADKAGIKVRANQARVYLVKDEQGNVTQVVLPMYGRWFMVNHVWFCFCCTRCEYYQRYYLL